jgi:hypothetical protein
VSCGRANPGKGSCESGGLPLLQTFRPAARPGISYTSSELLDFLRTVAGQLQNGKPREFYSIRHIRDHTGSPMSSVRRGVDQLKREGVLTACWGSQTILQPRNLHHDVHFHGSVTELVPLREFKTDPACESLAKDVHSELWRRRYACRMYFYEPHQAEEPAFCDQIIGERPDAIVWITPTARRTLLADRLLSCGTRVIRALAVANVLSVLGS